MILGSRRISCVLGLSATVVLGAAAPAFVVAQSGQPEDLRIKEPTSADLVNDFIHYVMIARTDLAHGSARALLDSGISQADLYRLIDSEIDEDRFENALQRALRINAIASIAGELEMAVRGGRQDVARDPDEIKRNIQLLLQGARAKQMAREALIAAGEYAVPQLLGVLISPERQALKTECRTMLVRIGRQAVTPLCAALPHLDSATQERICSVLSQIGYKHALPSLFDLSVNTNATTGVQEAASTAFNRLGGNAGARSESLWLGLAEQYWRESSSLFAWPGEARSNVWSYDNQMGLVSVGAPTEIYAEIMTMESCTQALRTNPNSLAGLSLWIAANFRRADQLGEGVDPTNVNGSMQNPLFYAVLAGPNASQAILARAIRDLDTQLARHAIDALNGTAGGSSLWAVGENASPLIESLVYPERRVRYDAALALGAALPQETFTGAERVVPTLAGALASGDQRFAAVLATSAEEQRAIAGNLRDMGFTVLPPQDSYAAMEADLVGTIGIDLFVVRQSLGESEATVRSIQADPRVAASPVMITIPAGLTTAQVSELNAMVEGDRRVGSMRLGLNDEQRGNAISFLVDNNLGSLISESDAEEYASRSLQTLRDIAVSNSPAFDVTQASGSLVSAMDGYSGELRYIAAETLSWINTAEAQRALMNAALNETDDLEQLLMLNFVAESARRYGAQITASQERRLLALIENTTGAVATEAAKAHGALNLDPSNAVQFIMDR